MKYYTLGRNMVLWMVPVQFALTWTLFTSFQKVLLLPVNILQHVTAVVFFVGIALAIWGLFIKQEYKMFRWTWWDIVFVLFVLVFTYENWYTLVTPHPLFNEKYFI